MGDRYSFAPDEPPDDLRFARSADWVARRLQDLIYPARVTGVLAAILLWGWLTYWSVVNAVSAGRAIQHDLRSGHAPTAGEVLAPVPAFVALGVPSTVGVVRLRHRRRTGAEARAAVTGDDDAVTGDDDAVTGDDDAVTGVDETSRLGDDAECGPGASSDRAAAESGDGGAERFAADSPTGDRGDRGDGGDDIRVGRVA